MNLNKQDDPLFLKRLAKPSLPIDVILDTDTYNEIDDQYALAFLVKLCEESKGKMQLRGIHAAPFLNNKSSSPGDGMEKSYDEIRRVLGLMNREDLIPLVMKGSSSFLSNERDPVDSPSARALAELALGYTEERPLYCVAIGAITNVASAILLQPEIINRMVVIWLGGHAHHWPDTAEFNMRQDVAAARVVFGSGIAVVQLPCMGVVSELRTSGPELEHHLRGKNSLSNYLLDTTAAQALEDEKIPTWTRVIWDVSAVGWLLDDDTYMEDYLCPSPIPQYDHHYSFDPARHPIRYVYRVHRDKLFLRLFTTLQG
ncbi:MAG: nucleoside hydrolase [Treponema sp.]|nr:nucleoside hydrolase [Treponema sp.]